ncbi:hypothetical protein ACC704_37090, partial [Rhizobium johnstonii]
KILRDLLRYNKEFLVGTILIAIILSFIVASFFSPYDENAIYVVAPDMPPSAEFWLGTTSRGQEDRNVRQCAERIVDSHDDLVGPPTDITGDQP